MGRVVQWNLKSERTFVIVASFLLSTPCGIDNNAWKLIWRINTIGCAKEQRTHRNRIDQKSSNHTHTHRERERNTRQDKWPKNQHAKNKCDNWKWCLIKVTIWAEFNNEWFDVCVFCIDEIKDWRAVDVAGLNFFFPSSISIIFKKIYLTINYKCEKWEKH